MDDWPTTVAEFQRLLGDRETQLRPTGVTGINFMTPEILGYVVDVNGHPAEITTGVFVDARYFGVTFSRLPDGSPNPRDKSCPSLADLVEHLGY